MSSTRSVPRPASSCPASRVSSCCRDRRANCSRCGRRRCRPMPSSRRSPAGTSYRQDMVRMFGLPESGLAETLRDAEGAGRGLRAARDHDVSAARGDRDGHPLRARRRAGVRTARGAVARPASARDLFRGRLAGGRPGRAAAGRSPDRDRGVVHGRAGGGAAHGPAGFVGICRRAESSHTPTTRRPSCSVWTRR